MQHNLQVNDKIETDKIIKVAPFRKDIRKTRPHKHNNYFEIIYLSEGSGSHYIDSTKFSIDPPVLFFLRNEQVHYWELDAEPEGYVLIIKKGFIDHSLDNELKSLLTQLSRYSSLSVQNTGMITQLFELLTREQKSETKNAFHIREGLLKALFAKVLEVAKPYISNTSIKTNLYQSYREILTQPGMLRNNVAWYAEQLSTTPQNLNTACRKAVGQSAAGILAEFIISEAKRLLIYTDNTVSEISFNLHFNDSSHFVKYFKRFTSVTPQSFRTLHG